jgi:FSR family fosmidomycin resistance protein-like MFS transporter
MNSNVTSILIAISFCHFLNDVLQSLIPAIYPILKENYNLTFTQIGLITLAFQLTASVLQPLVGYYTDKKPRPYSLVFGMTYTWFGLLVLSVAGNFYSIIIGAMLVGSGSSIFHPESSRIARLASKGKYGFAQSLFQVGGNIGSALGPLLAAFIVLPHGQMSLSWFSVLTMLGIIILFRIGKWYKAAHLNALSKSPIVHHSKATKGEIKTAITVLVALIFSKYFYSASMNNYYTFYLIETFGLSVSDAQIHLFYFMGASAVGALGGGLISDRFGRRKLMWFSILGAMPFTLLLPYADLFWTKILSVIIGLIISSTFSSIVVYAQELIPGKVGTIAGLFFGLAFGMAAIGAALLGKLADITSINYVFEICSYLPLIGVLIWFLPDVESRK